MSDPVPPLLPPPAGPVRRWPLMLCLGALAAGVAVMLVLHFFPPGHYPIYPVCPLRQHTGLDCPGCGGLRAMHQLTNGNFAAAWHLNPFVFVLAPLGIYETAVRFSANRARLSLLARPRLLLALGLLLLAFTILRNLPRLAQWFT